MTVTRVLVLLILAAASTAIHAQNLYSFEFQLETSSGVEGPLAIQTAEGSPVELTTPAGHKVSLTLTGVAHDAGLKTRIDSLVTLDSAQGGETQHMPAMLLEGEGEGSLALQAANGKEELLKLTINITGITRPSADMASQ